MYLGIYHSPFNQGCGQDPRIGGAGHERVDAQTFADGASTTSSTTGAAGGRARTAGALLPAMRDALRATGRRIFYSINPNSSATQTPEPGTTGRRSPT